MRRSPAVFAAAALLIVIAALVAWRVSRRAAVAPFSIEPGALTGWPVAISDGSDPWVVAVTPPAPLLAQLRQEATRRAGHPLAAPAHAGVPLVLRSEFEEGLQGVYGTDSVMRIAREAGIESAPFEPVCLARKRATRSGGSAEVYFVPFESAVFDQMRVDLVPAEPEHAGVGVYEPGTLTPILIVGASDSAFEQWWPLQFDPKTDCISTLSVTRSR